MAAGGRERYIIWLSVLESDAGLLSQLKAFHDNPSYSDGQGGDSMANNIMIFFSRVLFFRVVCDCQSITERGPWRAIDDLGGSVIRSPRKSKNFDAAQEIDANRGRGWGGNVADKTRENPLPPLPKRLRIVSIVIRQSIHTFFLASIALSPFVESVKPSSSWTEISNVLGTPAMIPLPSVSHPAWRIPSTKEDKCCAVT